MLDFASSLYLGLRHASDSLAPWDALTRGRPAALCEPPTARAVADDLAVLVGCEAATLLPSTFHLFWDLLGVLSRQPIEIFMDAATYPIARWGAEHWAGQGVPMQTFPRHDADALAQRLRKLAHRRPVVLCDGYCPANPSQPPLAAYVALAHRHRGWLLIDDTQALGIHGQQASAAAPYGFGGGGSFRRNGISGAHVIIGASLAKGFGVPVAMLAGSAALLRNFERDSASREYMSPPSLAVIHAAGHALAVNRRHGNRLRLRLWRAVQRLRGGLTAFGLATLGDDFPVQTLVTPASTDVRRLSRYLLDAGVQAVPQRDRRGGARLSLLVRADHRAAQIDKVVALVAQACTDASVPA